MHFDHAKVILCIDVEKKPLNPLMGCMHKNLINTAMKMAMDFFEIKASNISRELENYEVCCRNNQECEFQARGTEIYALLKEIASSFSTTFDVLECFLKSVEHLHHSVPTESGDAATKLFNDLSVLLTEKNSN